MIDDYVGSTDVTNEFMTADEVKEAGTRRD